MIRAIANVLAVVRRIVGAPDYELYLTHFAKHHPEGRPLGEQEFRDDRLNARYSQPGSRCC